MNTQIADATEYRDLPLAMLTESPTNPRRIFEDDALKEMAETVRDKGVYQPLLVRPLGERNFEIVFGVLKLIFLEELVDQSRVGRVRCKIVEMLTHPRKRHGLLIQGSLTNLLFDFLVRVNQFHRRCVLRRVLRCGLYDT